MSLLFKFRWLLALFLYLLFTCYQYVCDFLPLWQRWRLFEVEVATKTAEIIQLRGQAGQIHFSSAVSKPNASSDDRLMSLLQLAREAHLQINAAESTGALLTAYGMADSYQVTMQGDENTLLQWLTRLPLQFPNAVIRDFHLTEEKQHLKINMQLLSYPLMPIKQQQAMATAYFFPLCGVRQLKLLDGGKLTLRDGIIQWRDMPIVDALAMLAKLLRYNVILSPQLAGRVSLQLQNVKLEEVWDLLLTTYSLGKRQVGNLWYIAPQEELFKQQQDALKWQSFNEQAAKLHMQVWPIHYAKAEDIAHLIQNSQASLLSRRGQVHVEKRTNALCVQDISEHLQKIRVLVKQLDIPVKQVLIKVRIASIDKDYEQELGVIFTTKASAGQSSGASIVKSLTREMGNYSVAIAKLTDSSIIDVKLSALEQAGHAELISNPSLFTANQQPASIEAGDEIPYQEQSDSGGTAISFKKAVLGLKVIPQILPNNQVLLQLQINQDRPGNHLVQGVPTISTHQIRTSVLVADGKTVVLGGIYEINQEAGENRIPYLSELPMIGNLFKQRLQKKNKRELLIFVTPKIMI